MPKKPPSLWKIAFYGKCPKCGKGHLFSGFLEIKNECESCKLNFLKHDIGDGASFITLFLVALVITTFAVVTEKYFQPPLYFHLIWAPIIIIKSVLLLRFFRGLLIGAQYKYRKSSFET